MFKDTEFMTACQKQRVFDRFKKVIDSRDIDLMNKSLYEHLHLHCGFIAHYDIHGFKAAYSGQDFRFFIQNFDRNHETCLRCWHSDYDDIIPLMIDYVTAHAKHIYQEIDTENRNQELVLLKTLADKHAFRLVPK